MATPTPQNTALIIPTYNAGPLAARMIEAIGRQGFMPGRWLVVDSSSKDGTADVFRRAGAEVMVISPADFDHGGTRQMAASICGESEFLIYLTHDAIPATTDAFAKLVAAFNDENVGVCYGRQLPRRGANAIEAQARLFNYPPVSLLTTPESARRQGVRATFCSNSFSGYRSSALRAVGGFPVKTIFGEDAVVAGRMLLAGWSKQYCAGAQVAHSHDYSIREEARRYFDVGALHAREPWIRESFGAAEGAGMVFLRGQIAYLLRRAPWLIPSAIVRAGVKYTFYRLGVSEARLPLSFKKRWSMNRRFWTA